MRNQKGITLIALVITIIVLLILAGVSIAMLTGENGILTNATESQQKTDYENAKEQIDIALAAIKTEALAQITTDNQYDVTDTDNMDALASDNVIGKTINSDSKYDVQKNAGTITITYTNNATKVSVTGNIDLDANASGGLITEATGTINGEAQS